MTRMLLAAFVTAAGVLTLVPQPATAQSGERTMPMRTPDGQPDVSGTFTFRTPDAARSTHPVRGTREPDGRGGRGVRGVRAQASEP